MDINLVKYILTTILLNIYYILYNITEISVPTPIDSSIIFAISSHLKERKREDFPNTPDKF